MHYGMAVDLKRCVGCQTCVTSCKLANHIPANVKWNRVVTDGGTGDDTSRGTYGGELYKQHYTVACMHCENPSCLEVCPTGATAKDPETGIVTVDYSVCIGCQTCITACPYEGVRTLVEGEPVYHIDVNFGDQGVQAHKADVVEKCTFCSHRLGTGKQPKCVESCPAWARYFGDLDDPESEISKIIASREYEQLLPEKGTNPSVYYLK